MNKILLFYLSLFYFSVHNLLAQKKGQQLIDSMMGELATKHEDTNKVTLLNRISFLNTDYDNKKGIELGKQALALAEKFQWKPGMAEAYNSIGTNYFHSNQLQTGLDYFKRAYGMNLELKNKKRLAQNLGNISLIYEMLGNYPKALDDLFKALKIFEEINDQIGIANQLGNIGNIYQESGNPKKAIYYDSLALIKNKELNDQNGVGIELGNIGNAMCDIGELDKSLDYTLQALKLFEELKQFEGITRNLNNLGVLYETKKDFSKALEYHFQSLKICEERVNNAGIMLSKGNIGELYLKLAKLETPLPKASFIPISKHECLILALGYVSKAVDMAKESGELNSWAYNLRVYSNALETMGSYKEALLNFKKYHELQDSVFSTDSKVKIENLTTEREVELKDKQIQIDSLAVEKKNDRELFLLAGIILMMIILLSIHRSFKKQKVLNAELTIEKKKSDDLLLNILPAEVAEELKSKGTSEAKNYDNVSVLFTDFVNFTGISEKMSAQELVAEIDFCFKAFDHIIEHNGLEKIKTIGDAYLAVCGLPNELSDHAERVTRAALEIQNFIATQKSGKFQIRIGIHSGPVVAGIVGIKKYAYDIWGDTVNTANRIENSAEEGKVNISGNTYELIKSKFNCTYRGKISAKNKEEMDMYYVDSMV